MLSDRNPRYHKILRFCSLFVKKASQTASLKCRCCPLPLQLSPFAFCPQPTCSESRLSLLNTCRAFSLVATCSHFLGYFFLRDSEKLDCLGEPSSEGREWRGCKELEMNICPPPTHTHTGVVRLHSCSRRKDQRPERQVWV